MYFTIDEVSKKTNISVDIIKLWAKKGLINTKKNNNSRLFDSEEVLRTFKKFNGDFNNNYKILKNNQKSKYSVIELFAGAGGTALGFENAGLNHLLLNELNKDCCSTLKENFSRDIKIVCDDVHNLDFFSYRNRVDIVQAGFPCQAFSYAGNGLGFEDTRGTLFFEFARCVKETNPKIAVGENVKGLLKHDNGRTLAAMIKTFEELGYKVRYKLLKAQYFDVPQKRERLIIMAIRKDLNLPFIFPEENDYTISVREALQDCPISEGQRYPLKKAEILAKVPEGGYWKDLPIALQKEYMKASFYHSGGKTGMARRLAWDEPSLTLTCSPAQKQTERCHPSETRPLNIREYARIQTFPDSWKFVGSISSQYKQIGNAVPVNLGYHIGQCLIKMLDNFN